MKAADLSAMRAAHSRLCAQWFRVYFDHDRTDPAVGRALDAIEQKIRQNAERYKEAQRDW